MSRSSVAGLHSALRLYESDKIKERTEGQSKLRDIFSNRDNLLIFQDSASGSGGAGWVAFFQCLFQVVVLEKKALLRKSATSQAEKRLADSISLVRWMAEKSVHMISRKPLQALVTHMTSLLVFAGRIFPPASLDYAKALRTLLSYPPHLENLDLQAWKVLTGVCWSAILGEEVSIEDGWDDEQRDELEEDEEIGNGGMPASTQAVASFAKGRSSVTQATTELALLIPILLSSTAAPLVHPLPVTGSYHYEPSLGLSILLKTQRFFTLYPLETSSHLPILRSMNIVLAALELNCRDDFIAGGAKLLPSLVDLWSAKNKAIREQVLIALRMILPFLTHKIAQDKDKTGTTRAAAERVMDMLPKETVMKSGFTPLDPGVLRLRLVEAGTSNQEDNIKPFETRAFTAGHDFDHESALRWTSMELYAEICFFLYQSHASTLPNTPGRDSTQAAKRRKLSDALSSLTHATTFGPTLARVHALQVLIFVINRRWNDIHLAGWTDILQNIIAILDEEDHTLQTWAFLAISVMATMSSTNTPTPSSSSSAPSAHALRRNVGDDFAKAWSYSMRKITLASLSRSACHAAFSLLQHGQVDLTSAVRDLGSLLQSMDIQGPSYPHDSVCALVSQAIRLARQDVRLYAMNLEDKVVSWLSKWTAIEGTRGRNRLDQHSPSDLLQLICEILHYPTLPFHSPSTTDFLPDCAIVERVLDQSRTMPIRQFTLFGNIVKVNATAKSRATCSMSTVIEHESGFLRGRPQRIANIIKDLIDAFGRDWPSAQSGSEARPAIPPDRCRRTIDMIVLAYAFNATLQLNGVRADADCVQAASSLLERVTPSIILPAYDIPSQHLIWGGLQPLIGSSSERIDLWPVLLKPNSQSGIRQDLLPRVDVDEDEGDEPLGLQDALVTTIWNFDTTKATLKALFGPCLKVFAGSESATPVTSSPYAPTQGIQEDDDDFGEIRTAESDAMPISKEAIECQRTTRLLLASLADFRLKGSMFLSPNRLPSKDTALINAFLSAEGPRMTQLGSVLCDAVQAGTLRLNVEAVDFILSTLEEMLASYAYARDEASLQLTLSFMTASAPIWLSPDNANIDLADRVIHLAKFLHLKMLKGQLPSWKVRLALLRFVDEYLDYEPEQTTWLRGGESMEVDGAANAAVDIISGALVDNDIRLRFRAATSTAGLLYLSSITFDQHLPFYHDTVNGLPREPRHWDSFVTDILWKLNCCITSPQLRAATIYHLYEVPPATSDYNHHLQVGLETVSTRLGLDGIAPLLLAYAPLIISSQIVTSQSPMRVPHRLYGFPTRRLFAVNILDVAGSSILLAMLAEKVRNDDGARQYYGSAETLTALCGAAGGGQGDIVVRHLAATAARAISDPHSPLVPSPEDYDRAKAFTMLSSLPGLRPKERALKKSSSQSASSKGIEGLPTVPEEVATHLFALLDLSSSDEEVIATLDARDRKAKIGTRTYGAIMASEVIMIASAPALTPTASVEDVLDGLAFLNQTYPSMSSAKVLFNTLSRLFNQINEDFLVSEQYRHLRGIALAFSLYASNMTHPAILGLFLRETIPLLKLVDTAPVALAMLRWGFDRIPEATRAPDDIEQLVIGLGMISSVLSAQAHETPIVGQFNAWISDSCGAWHQVDSMRGPLSIAKTVWPRHLADCIENIEQPTSAQLCESTKTLNGIDTLPLCHAMIKALPDQPHSRSKDLQVFQEDAFWKIKDNLPQGDRNDIDVSAFLDLLYAGHGQIHPPHLNSPQMDIQTDRLAPLKTRLKEDAGPYIRAALVDRIVSLTRISEYKARHTAMEVLQGLLPYVKDEKTGSLVPPATKDLLALLNPVTPPSTTFAKIAFSTLIEDSSWIQRSRDAATWTADLATFLCSSLSISQSFYSIIPSLFETITPAARDLFPYLVQASLSNVNLAEKDAVPECYQPLSQYLMQVLQYPAVPVDTLRVIVDIVLHLRNYAPPYRQDELGHEEWLEVDYLRLSQAALKCGSYATSLMFLELVRSDRAKNLRAVDLYDARVQEIMYEAYSNVEDPDGFYGIKTQDAWGALDKRLRHEGDHWRSFGIHSATLEAGSTDPNTTTSTSFGVMRDLHNLGLDRVGNAMFAAMRSTSDGTSTELSEPLLFELAWRTSDWDLPIKVDDRSSPQSLLYSSLRAVHRERDLVVARKTVSTALNLNIGSMLDSGAEKITQLKNTVTDLLCLHEIQRWLDPSFQQDLEARDVDYPSVRRFTSLDSAFVFGDAEKIISTRRSLLSAARERESQNLFGDLGSPRMDFLTLLESRCLLRLGEIARGEGNTQASINALCALKRLNPNPSDEVEDEFGQVLWAQGEHILAIRHLETRVKVLKASKAKSGSKMAVLLSRMANWTSRAKLRAPQEIANLFEEAVKLSQAFKLSATELGRLYHDYAIFADQHQAALRKSPELERLNNFRERREAERSGTHSTSSRKSAKSSVRTQATDKLEKEVREDEEALSALLEETSSYARTALKMYALSLASSDEFDDSTTRMCSLWLEHDDDDQINKEFRDPLAQIPSYKFIFLSPQLAARLDRPKSPTSFNNALNGLVLRISREHPFHILYQVITLADGLSSLSASRRTSEAGSEGRGPAAAAILAHIAGSKDTKDALARSASTDMQQLATAATTWCLSRNDEEERASIGKALAVPVNCPLRLLSTKMTTPVATAAVPVDPLGRYKDIPTLFRYRTSYTILGGIHRPKRMQVYDSVGTTYKELFKGDDELRQDAVMEQVFEMSNKLLTRDRRTKARDLRFRTYKVIPLARKTGIMEFVGNSQAIGDWLKPAHTRYGKINGDLPPEEFRKKLSPLQEKEKTWNQLPALFTDLQSKFRPVLRHFFTEKHRDPMGWFTMRLKYTRSVAVTSMVGWVLGIGDRHCSNILIDQMSGELVHIDFGIVFEDGRSLRIPEKVPFRLTNDLVDGFGLTGVDGTFRQCSEHTLRVLRESSELIMTVLEVFKHDPLYAWDADPEKMQRAQGGGRVAAGATSVTAVEKADRILSKIQGKLRDDLSVEYTVNQLIQEARDVENLAKIFVGWQPWF